MATRGSTYAIEITHKDSQMISWYIKKNEIRNVQTRTKRLMNVPHFINCLISSFVEETILPEYERSLQLKAVEAKNEENDERTTLPKNSHSQDLPNSESSADTISYNELKRQEKLSNREKQSPN